MYLDTLKNRLPLPTHRVPENPLEKQQEHGLYPHRVLLKCTFSLGASEGETTKPNQDLQPGGKKANLLGPNQHTAGYRREKKRRGGRGRQVSCLQSPVKQANRFCCGSRTVCSLLRGSVVSCSQLCVQRRAHEGVASCSASARLCALSHSFSCFISVCF